MIVAGLDIGSLSAKAVLLKESEMIASSVVRCGASPADSAKNALDAALESANLGIEKIERLTATGYGRQQIKLANSVESEIVCHARGALKQAPQARMLIDIGGQDAKALRFNEDGSVNRFQYNDKCASGTGRFLEIIAQALEIELEEMGALSRRATESLTLSNQCVIFAETEILSLVAEGVETADIIKALHHAVARRVGSLAKSIELAENIAMSGGVALNRGVFEALEETLGVRLIALENPQINGALGAALIAEEEGAS